MGNTFLPQSLSLSAREYLRALGRWWLLLAGHVGVDALAAADVLQSLRQDKELILPLWLWVFCAMVSLVIASFIAFHRVRVERDVLADTKNEEHQLLEGIEDDLQNLRSRIGSRDRDQVWTFVGRHIETLIEHSRLLPVEMYPDLHARFNAAKAAEIDWQDGAFISKHTVVIYISRFGQRTEREVISAFRDEDLRWGIDHLMGLSQERMEWIAANVPPYPSRPTHGLVPQSPPQDAPE